MTNYEKYDVLVLGSGEAGKYLAWTLAKSGKRTAVIERRYIGGSCPNIACLPSKNVIHSAKVASYLSRSQEFGITTGESAVRMSGVRDRKRAMVDALVKIHLDRYHASGAELVIGEGKFSAPRALEVNLSAGGTRTLEGEMVVISTGTRAAVDNIEGLAAAQPLTHVEALELDVVPDHLLVFGGGYVGLELAQALRRFGARVTILERKDRLAPREDQDVSKALQKICEQEGINLALSTEITRVEGRSGEHVTVHATVNGDSTMFTGSHILAATGRVPNSQNIGLDVAGIECAETGYIKVNERLETTAPNVWAVGDCAGSPHFTHIAFDDFRIIRDNLAGGHRVTTGRQVPFCLFTDPEFARIGLNEAEAAQRGIQYRVARLPMAAVLRTRTLSETTGFMKALIAKDSDQILGFTAISIGAGETMAVVQLAMSAGLPYTFLRDSILTHPTLAEGLNVLFADPPVTPET
jgi:pyruvate/2-oxoglutarate dehydrogenase complex dihydrolipoamide dehydrogenase (E3) component